MKRKEMESMSATDYEMFQDSSCIRKDFTVQYFLMGAMEEAAEVLEAVDSKESANAIIKEVGDAMWYCVGLTKSCGIDFQGVVGEDWSIAASTADQSERELIIRIGSLAGK
jgi:NTP pyrophosphatase (non-canonical NTP hydrolase)